MKQKFIHCPKRLDKRGFSFYNSNTVQNSLYPAEGHRSVVWDAGLSQEQDSFRFSNQFRNRICKRRGGVY